MTAKQEFYLLCKECDSQLSVQQVRQFVSSHHSVQWRKQGRSNIQVRFNDHESWMDVSSFADNYHNKVCKQLNDLMLSSSKVVTHGDLWEMTSTEFKKAVSNHVINQAREKQLLATAEDYNEIVDQLNTERKKNYQLQQQLSETTKKHDASKMVNAQLLKSMDVASHMLQEACSSMVVSKDKVKGAIEVLERR